MWNCKKIDMWNCKKWVKYHMLLIALHGSKPHSIYLAEHPEYLIFIFDLTVQKIKDMF